MAFTATGLGLQRGPVAIGDSESARFEHNQWVYRSDTDALGTIDNAGYFAAKGSTSGDGEFNAGDVLLVIGTDGVGWYQVSDAAAGTVTAF